MWRDPGGPGPSLACHFSAVSFPKEGKLGHIFKITFPVELHSPLLSPLRVLSAYYNCRAQPWNTVFFCTPKILLQPEVEGA